MFAAMKLSRKLSLGFGVMILLLVVLGGMSFKAMRDMSTDINELANNWLPSIKTLGKANDLINRARRYQQRYLASTTAEELASTGKEVLVSIADGDKVIKEYGALVASPNEKIMYDDLAAQWKEYVASSAKITELMQQKRHDEAVAHSNGPVLKEFRDAHDAMLKLVDYNDVEARKQAEAGQASYHDGLLIISVVLALALAAGIGVAVLLIRGVMAQLGEDPGYLAEVAGKIAAGDLNVAFRPQKKQGGVYHVLQGMVATMKAKIAEAETKSAEAAEEGRRAKIAADEANEAKARAERAKAEGMVEAANQLERVVEVISSASEELSAQVEQSSRGAEQQSARVAETATAMEEMNSTVLEVAKNASQAAESSDAARKKAGEGSQVVAQVVQGIGTMQQVSISLKEDMGVLGKQAEGIGQVMNVISDIADQTNLLALNAAIEAARAGDAGRGFAVVADEVRKLAEKTMTATKEVGETVRGIQDVSASNIRGMEEAGRAIAESTELVRQSGKALDEIVRMSESTALQVQSIATAAEEQSAASEEINQAVDQINAIAGETAQSMQQTTIAIRELAEQAENLRSLVADLKREGSS